MLLHKQATQHTTIILEGASHFNDLSLPNRTGLMLNSQSTRLFDQTHTSSKSMSNKQQSTRSRVRHVNNFYRLLSSPPSIHVAISPESSPCGHKLLTNNNQPQRGETWLSIHVLEVHIQTTCEKLQLYIVYFSNFRKLRNDVSHCKFTI